VGGGDIDEGGGILSQGFLLRWFPEWSSGLALAGRRTRAQSWLTVVIFGVFVLHDRRALKTHLPGNLQRCIGATPLRRLESAQIQPTATREADIGYIYPRACFRNTASSDELHPSVAMQPLRPSSYAASHQSPRLIYSLNQSAVHDWPGHPETADRVARYVVVGSRDAPCPLLSRSVSSSS